ncbi:MAG: hypothetical protein IPM92_05785 [Saprospiraceae bacterium]|nr:hypothetical protein [Saprospiraceae bacterium]
MNIPKLFIQNMEKLIGSESSAFFEAIHQNPKTSVRLNPLKSEHNLNLAERVPWCEQGYYLNERPVFTLDPFFHAGHYYVQEASSMFLDYVLKYLNLPKDIHVLDICSAPGGKSTLLASYFSESAFIHCHEFDQHRTTALQHNMIKWGHSNITISQGSLKELKNTGITYDLILLDAPCSGEGMFRKERKALEQWSPEKIQSCQRMQKEIVQIVAQLGHENSILIYSTCTYNMFENEEVLSTLISNGTYDPVEINSDYNVWKSDNESNLYSYRFMPHRIQGEGLTLTVLRKNKNSTSIEYSGKKSFKEFQNPFSPKAWLQDSEEFIIKDFKKQLLAIRKSHLENSNLCLQHLNVWNTGIQLGQIKGLDFIPHHGLSQSAFKSNELPEIQLDYKQALEYLRCLHFPLDVNTSEKWFVAKFQSASMGWIKSNSNGWKNYYPKHYRILSY